MFQYVATGVVLAVLSSSLVTAQDSLDLQEERAFQQAVAIAAPSLVRIDTIGGVDRIGELLTSSAPTTGVIVSPDGEIITSSFNFASRPSSVLVTLADGRRFPATIVAKDESRMLTLLRINAAELIPIRPAPADSIRVGQWSIAVGKTLSGEIPNLSVGIVSAIGRIWGKAVQTDAKVSPVNYGGPLLDIQGRAIGILVPLSPEEREETAGVQWYDSGIGFAVPLTDVLTVLERLRDGTDQKPGLLGVTFKSMGMLDEPVVEQVRFDSPAEQAGLENGDRIVAADEMPTSRMAQLRHVLGRKYAGETLSLTIRRGDDTREVSAVLTDELRPFFPLWAGLLPQRRGANNGNSNGVQVRFVWPDGPAAQAGVQAGDLITHIGEEAVDSEAVLRRRILRSQADETATLTMVREGRETQVEISPVRADIPIAEDLPSFLIPDPAAGEERPKTGRFAEAFAQFERDYWAYVPESYHPEYGYGLVLWLHPPGNPLEATVMQRWRAACDRRGLILLAPKIKGAGNWSLADLEFVKELAAEFRNTYNIDDRRIVVHAASESAAFAAFVAFREAVPATGLVLVDTAMRGRVPENSPERSLQFLLLPSTADEKAEQVTETAEMLRSRGYPVAIGETSSLDSGYVSGETVDRISRWIDSLDWL